MSLNQFYLERLNFCRNSKLMKCGTWLQIYYVQNIFSVFRIKWHGVAFRLAHRQIAGFLLLWRAKISKQFLPSIQIAEVLFERCRFLVWLESLESWAHQIKPRNKKSHHLVGLCETLCQSCQSHLVQNAYVRPRPTHPSTRSCTTDSHAMTISLAIFRLYRVPSKLAKEQIYTQLLDRSTQTSHFSARIGKTED